MINYQRVLTIFDIESCMKTVCLKSKQVTPSILVNSYKQILLICAPYRFLCIRSLVFGYLCMFCLCCLLYTVCVFVGLGRLQFHTVNLLICKTANGIHHDSMRTVTANTCIDKIEMCTKTSCSMCYRQSQKWIKFQQYNN